MGVLQLDLRGPSPSNMASKSCRAWQKDGNSAICTLPSAKAGVEWHPDELYPRVGFIVTNLARPAARVVAFYNQRGTAEQWIKEGKGAIKWTRLSCRAFAANAVRLQLHILAYNLGNFMRTLALPKAAEPWSLTSLKTKLIKIGAKVVSHGRYVAFQMAEVILRLIAELGPPPVASTA